MILYMQMIIELSITSFNQSLFCGFWTCQPLNSGHVIYCTVAVDITHCCTVDMSPSALWTCDQPSHVTPGTPELDPAVPHVGAHPAAPTLGTWCHPGVSAHMAHPGHMLRVPQWCHQSPQLPGLI